MTAALVVSVGFLASRAAIGTRPIEYADLPRPARATLSTFGITEQGFSAYVAQLNTEARRRVADGDREHLIYYALQSSRFTDRPRIEPAVSARRFVEGLTEAQRQRLLEDPMYLPDAGWPPAERARMTDLLSALGKEPADARLTYFRQLAQSIDARPLSAEALYADYVRAARFLYRKEFVTGAGGARPTATEVARLYQSRPYSSDTQIEAGFGVYLGLGTLRDLSPHMRVTRVLVVGPGLDLAPRTNLLDAVDPQSLQPFAVADALLALSLAGEHELSVYALDVNERVVRAVQMAAREGVTLHLFTGVAETPDQPFSADYRAYIGGLGHAIGDEVRLPPSILSQPYDAGSYQRSIAVRAAVASAIRAGRLDVVTERLAGEPPFDIVIATNVLTYFDDRQLVLALSNMAAMLRPGGYLLHNESRGTLVEMANGVGLPVTHMRTAVLRGPREQPLYDVVWLHQKELRIGN